MITFSYKSCSSSNIFMESNYFEAVKRPIMSSLSYITYAANPASFDAYEVAKPSDQLPLPALANILDSYESGVVKVMGVE